MCRGDGKSDRDWVGQVAEEIVTDGLPSEDRSFLEDLHRGRRVPRVVARRVSVKEINPMTHVDVREDEPIMEIPGTPGLPSLRVAGRSLRNATCDSTLALDELIDNGINPSWVFRLAQAEM